MSYRNMRMADGHLSLDRLLDDIDAEKAPVLSDGGEGARRIYRAADAEAEDERDLQLDNQRFVLLMVAEALLVVAGLKRLVPVLEQVVEGRRKRQEQAGVDLPPVEGLAHQEDLREEEIQQE